MFFSIVGDLLKAHGDASLFLPEDDPWRCPAALVVRFGGKIIGIGGDAYYERVCFSIL